MAETVKARRRHADFVTLTMEIPLPVGNVGQAVEVRNYRCRPPRWEPGEIKWAEYRNRGGGFSWHYMVVLYRSAPLHPIRLYCGNDGVRPAPGT
jgi:hypothetical protein